MPDEDRLKRRYEILDKLIEILSHGEAKITWANKTIVKVEKIQTESEITKQSLT